MVCNARDKAAGLYSPYRSDTIKCLFLALLPFLVAYAEASDTNVSGGSQPTAAVDTAEGLSINVEEPAAQLARQGKGQAVAVVFAFAAALAVAVLAVFHAREKTEEDVRPGPACGTAVLTTYSMW